MRPSFCQRLAYTAVALGLGSSASAAKIDLVLNQQATISIVGEIAPGDVDLFKSLLTKADDERAKIEGIRLNSIGGNVFEGVAIMRTVAAHRLNTHVEAGDVCASICFLVFAAGAEKYADLSAHIGVHSASNEWGEKDAASEAGTTAMARMAKMFDVPSKVIEQMSDTPADQIFWLNHLDLEAMGVIFTREDK